MKESDRQRGREGGRKESGQVRCCFSLVHHLTSPAYEMTRGSEKRRGETRRGGEKKSEGRRVGEGGEKTINKCKRGKSNFPAL